MIKFDYQGMQKKLSKYLSECYPLVGQSRLRSMLKSKDVKINGARTKEDVLLCDGDRVELFCGDLKIPCIPIIFEDTNILIVDKPSGIESTDGIQTCEGLLRESHPDILSVHRLDRNTTGLLLFAKNEPARNALKAAQKNGGIKKLYTARVFGVPKPPSDILTAYLAKDSDVGIVRISKTPMQGYKKIETAYSTVCEDGSSAVLRLELRRGKTHQLRAHLAFIGHFILGDGKYGDNKTNKEYKLPHQALRADSIVFDKLPYPLDYLSGKEIIL